MFSRKTAKLERLIQENQGFSLIEVVLSLGIIAFCMVSVFGLLPVGLSSQQNSLEQGRAAAILNMVSTATQSITSPNASGEGDYQFPAYFSETKTKQDLADFGSKAFSIMEDGSIRQSGNGKDARQTLFIKVEASTATLPVRIYAAVAWPWKPGDTAMTTPDSLASRAGFQDAYIVFSPLK